MADNLAGKARVEKGRLTVLACPQCDSAIYEYANGDRLSFRCEFDHSYKPDQIYPGAEEDFRQTWSGVLRTLALS